MSSMAFLNRAIEAAADDYCIPFIVEKIQVLEWKLISEQHTIQDFAVKFSLTGRPEIDEELDRAIEIKLAQLKGEINSHRLAAI